MYFQIVVSHEWFVAILWPVEELYYRILVELKTICMGFNSSITKQTETVPYKVALSVFWICCLAQYL